MVNDKSKKPMDIFFNLGAKVTKDDPILKAKFDYQLYWVIFLTFIGVAINYFRVFFVTHSIGALLWGIIIIVFSWFNYWGLAAFKQTYDNMKKFYGQKKEEPVKLEPNQVKTESNNDKEKEEFSKAFS